MNNKSDFILAKFQEQEKQKISFFEIRLESKSQKRSENFYQVIGEIRKEKKTSEFKLQNAAFRVHA